jgi:hypothetical protein
VSFLFEHDLFGKPVPAFPDHALPVLTNQRMMAGDQLVCRHQPELRHFLGAAAVGARAARAEAAA